MALAECSARELRHHLGPEASVVTGSHAEARIYWSRFRQTSHGITQLIAPIERRSGVGFAVISRYMADISADPPQMLRCQTLPSMWTLGKDEPVIPGVPFIR